MMLLRYRLRVGSSCIDFIAVQAALHSCPMALMTLANLKHAHGDNRVLDGVSLSLDRGQKVGLVGRNGCGKSTLMRIICGNYPPDEGQVQMARGTRVGYLPQDPKLDGQRTLRREAEQAFSELADLHDRIDDVSHRMAEATDPTETDALMKEYEKLEHRMQAAGGYTVDHRIDAMLHGLGLGDETFNVQVADLSGGQKARLAMCKLLLSEPDVLLLDEPTNHLDIDGRQWLEQFLKAYDGAVMVISHDRWLLDEVVEKIVELERGRLVEYPGNYQAFREQRVVRQLEQKREYDKQQTYIRHQKQYIQKYKTGQRAKEARGREKRLERFIRDEVVEQIRDDAVMGLNLSKAPRSGDIVMTAHDITKAYDQKKLFTSVSVSIKRGQRIGVIGPNGCGKSTLIRTLMTEAQPDAGTVKLGSSLSIGYYRQTHEDLDDADTPVTYLQRRVPDTMEQAARDVAGAFLFSGTDQDKPFGVLSGGERTRAVLAGLVIGGHNLLVLDEPSNHLDIPSAERLEAALCQFDGTLILITHDRMLLQDTVDELLVFDGHGNVRHFFGKYSDYLAASHAGIEAARHEGTKEEKTEGNRQKAKEKSDRLATATKSPRPRKPQSSSRKPKKGKHAWLKQEDLEKQITDLESQLAALDTRLADPDLYRDKDAFRDVHDQREKLAEKLKPLEEEWLRRAEDDG